MTGPESVWVPVGTLTLPYGTLATLHAAGTEVHLRQNILSGEKRVFKKVSLLGREDAIALNEVTLLQGIDDDNVAQVIDVIEVAGSDAALRIVEMVMPYYPEGSFFDIMDKGRRFSCAEARDNIVQVLRGLGHLHDCQRILHRDIKPGNLFLGDDGFVKVGDFGEAVRMGDDGTADPLIQAQYWTPPESFCGGRHTTASDLYGVGMTLRELLSGRLPYDDYTREELANRLASNKCAVKDRHLVFAPHVRPALRKVARKATQREPSERYQSADAMARDMLNARFVDWHWPETTSTTFAWTGSYKDHEFRVTARVLRGGHWRARAERHYIGGWRRFQGSTDADAPDPIDAAEAAFSQIDKHLPKV